MKNKIKINFGVIIIAFAILFLPLVYCADDWPPKQTLTLQSFLSDAKGNTNNYYILINRTQQEIDYMKGNTELGKFLNYMGLDVSNYFKDDCKNFILLEIPQTYVGNIFSLQKQYSYAQVYQDRFLQDQTYDYYLANNWCTFNYTVVNIVPQALHFDFSTQEKMSESKKIINKVDSDGDGFLSEQELALNYLNEILSYIESNKINTDYFVLDEQNQVKQLDFGSRDYCPGYNESNNIFTKYTYQPDGINMSEYCVSSQNVSELVCNSGGVYFSSIACPGGYSCVDGACISKTAIRQDSIFYVLIQWLSRIISTDILQKEIIKWILK